MAVRSSQKINQNDIKNKSIFFRFDNILVYIIVIIDEIITLIKIQILKREEKIKKIKKKYYYSVFKSFQNTFLFCQKRFYKVKNEQILILVIKEIKK